MSKAPVDEAAAKRAKDQKYKSGNEGRLHPHLIHPGYYGEKKTYAGVKPMEKEAA